MSNFQKIKDRIDVLTKFLGKTVSELEKGDKKDFPKEDDRLLGNATISGWYDKSVTWTSDKLDKFLKYYNIRKEWWETGEGQILLTSVQKTGDNNKKDGIDEVLQHLMEGNSQYILINRELILEKYRLVSIEKMEEEKRESERKHQEILKDLEDRKNQIHGLYKLISEITSKIPDPGSSKVPEFDKAH